MSDLPADTLTTTIEQAVRAHWPKHTGCSCGAEVRNVRHVTETLAAAVVSVLATHNEHAAADAWEQGALWALEDQGATVDVWLREAVAGHNPHRLAAVSPTPSSNVHNHPPHRPNCNERRVNGQLRGACLNDDGTAAVSPTPPTHKEQA
jgi:hypothetical protein